MSWAARRRFIILFILGAIAAAFFAIVSIATFYKAPSCTDTTQNQDEEGIDCGGSCPYLCTAQRQPPTILFTKAISNGVGRTDVAALVENKNATAAAKNVPYAVTLYGDDRTILQTVSGTLDLPPGATVPVFISGVVSGNQRVANVFLDIATSSPKWFVLSPDPRIVPLVSDTKPSGTVSAPRIETVLTNQSVTRLTNVEVVVIVRDAQGIVIAASKTIVSVIPAQGQATATFTWNNAFSGVPASIEVVPVIPLF